jgi:hypothetical protein
METLPQLYHKQMIEVKRRLIAVDRILGAKNGKPRTLTEEYDNEFMWLQLRKIVELIAFSAMVSDVDRYAALRTQQNSNGDFRRDWRAEKILNHLALIDPKFLPLPLGAMEVQHEEIKHFQGAPEAQQATLDRLVAIHQMAGQHLHAGNPFDADNAPEDLWPIAESRQRIVTEHSYLRAALAEHFKFGLDAIGDDPNEPANPDQAWLIVMGESNTLEVRMVLAKPLQQ